MIAVATVGPIGSGKDTAIKYVSRRYKMPMVSIGEVVAEIARREGVKPTRDNLHKISQKYFKSYGPEFFPKKVAEKAKSLGWNSVAIAGVRYPSDIIAFRKVFERFLVFYIRTDAPEERFRRLRQRNEPRDPKNLEEFMIQDKHEKKIFHLEETFRMADVVVDNNRTLQELHQKIDGILKPFLLDASE